MPEEMASMPKPILRQAAIIASEQAQGRGGDGGGTRDRSDTTATATTLMIQAKIHLPS